MLNAKKEEVKTFASHLIKDIFSIRIKKTSDDLVYACALFKQITQKKYTHQSKKYVQIYDELTLHFNELNEKERFLYYLYISELDNATNYIVSLHDESFIIDMQMQKDMLYHNIEEAETKNDDITHEEYQSDTDKIQ